MRPRGKRDAPVMQSGGPRALEPLAAWPGFFEERRLARHDHSAG
jgi:hypothetical protein